MPKIKRWHSRLLLVLCILSASWLASCTANSQQQSIPEVRAEAVPAPQSKRELARKVLSEIGIPEKYNLYFGSSIELAFPNGGESNSKLRDWLQAVLVREAGWAKIENTYIARLEANFSEAELKELLQLSRQPLMKKLLQNELQAYADASPERRRLLSKFWDDYNSGNINPPSNL